MFWSQTVGIKSRDPRLNKSAQKIKTQLHDYKKTNQSSFNDHNFITSFLLEYWETDVT